VTQATRKALWDELRDTGYVFTKHYRDYSEQELADLVAERRRPVQAPQTEQAPDQARIHLEAEIEQLRATPPETQAGKSMNRHEGFTKPIRIDEAGRLWYQDEIRKPDYAKPRERRVLRYIDPGVKTVVRKDQNGSIVESFEVPGDEQREAEAKIMLPSYQIGCYRDPALLGEFFKIHVYNNKEVFDLFDVQAYFGGPRAVPASVKRDYADTVLGYDIQSVIQAIDDIYRQKLKDGEIKKVDA